MNSLQRIKRFVFKQTQRCCGKITARYQLITAAVYLIVLLTLRIIGTITLLPCNENGNGCDVWTNSYLIVYVITRLASVCYYVAFKSALVDLCNLKYYGESDWMVYKLRNVI